MKKKETSDDKKWLMDAEVRYRITANCGRWEVALIFINTVDPTQFLVRQIGDYRSERLAIIHGSNMQRTAARDHRGTRRVDDNAYTINNN